MSIPNVCFVNVVPSEGSPAFGLKIMCGAMACAWIASEQADCLEDLGWSFNFDSPEEIPVCPTHFGLAADALSPDNGCGV